MVLCISQDSILTLDKTVVTTGEWNERGAVQVGGLYTSIDTTVVTTGEWNERGAGLYTSIRYDSGNDRRVEGTWCRTVY